MTYSEGIHGQKAENKQTKNECIISEHDQKGSGGWQDNVTVSRDRVLRGHFLGMGHFACL